MISKTASINSRSPKPSASFLGSSGSRPASWECRRLTVFAYGVLLGLALLSAGSREHRAAKRSWTSSLSFR